MKIEYPAPEEQRASVRHIVDMGIVPRRTLIACFDEMYRSLSLRIIFWDMADVILIAFLGTAYVFNLVFKSIQLRPGLPEKIYAVLFTVAPTMYFLLCVLGFWKERMSGTYDVKMSCKFTVNHLTAFRMLIFSCTCIVTNLAMVGIFYAVGAVADFWQAFLVTASSLFLFSAVLLWSLLRGGKTVAFVFTAVIWMLVNIMLYMFSRDAYGYFLQTVPLYLHIAVAAALFYLYLAGLKRLILKPKEKTLC